MTLCTETNRLIIDPSADGRFPRAQGGRCDFRPALGPALEGAIASDMGDPAAVRTVYPRPSSPVDREDWVRIRW
ncbi:hypothetical protein [Sphingomonas sp. Leaf21]|uniref:hypothetical protein n=1 Tax=Sphingomonas sp. Leaf21 TaxID=2876550 RepID=UPI001E2D7B73|nr:hypothetical protein [Sphingomonas sp. Leaf21]